MQKTGVNDSGFYIVCIIVYRNVKKVLTDTE